MDNCSNGGTLTERLTPSRCRLRGGVSMMTALVWYQVRHALCTLEEAQPHGFIQQ